MKAAIIVFSPSGHTLRAAEIFQSAFEGKTISTQLIDITKRPYYLDKDSMKQQLEKDLEEHDVLLVGGPVYAGHMEGHILRLIDRLPEAGGKYGSLAVPFVTYGGVHSSVALEEAGKLLKAKKRKPILGVKIAAEHTLTRTFAKTIYKNRPGKEEEEIILQAVEKIIEIAAVPPERIKDACKALAYSRPMERLMFRLFSQASIHKKYKRVSIDAQKCIQCKKCISVCPVNMFDFAGGKVRMARDSRQCILCAECYHHCPAGAVIHPYIEVAKKRLRDGNAVLEKKPSAIYL